MADVDPYAFIVLGHCSLSQEEYLHSKQYPHKSQEAIEINSSEEPIQSEDFPVASTGIVIRSLPESSNRIISQEEEFQTPPEEPLLVLSSDEQPTRNPGKRALNDDLFKYSDLGFSREKSHVAKGRDFEHGVGVAESKETEIIENPSGKKRRGFLTGGVPAVRKNAPLKESGLISDTEKFEHFNFSTDCNPEVRSQPPSGFRKLPHSILEPVENAPNSRKKQVTNLLEAINRVAGEKKQQSFEDVDILEIAKQRGITFPRPRWWRKPGGY